MKKYSEDVLATLDMINMLIEGEIEEAERIKCPNTLEVLKSIKLKIDCQILAQKMRYKLENTKDGDWFL